jgi:type I restriction enzyme, R subunit
MTENQLEQEALGWLAELGYAVHTGAELAHDGPHPQRVNHRQVVLPGRLRASIEQLNPGIPAAAREDAWQRVQDLGLPSLLSANRALHKLLVGGVPVQYMRDGETVGDWVRLVDWSDPGRNEFWAVNQFTIKGPHHTRRYLEGLRPERRAGGRDPQAHRPRTDGNFAQIQIPARPNRCGH